MYEYLEMENSLTDGIGNIERLDARTRGKLYIVGISDGLLRESNCRAKLGRTISIENRILQETY